MKYVSIDIETTGLDPKRNQIVEIGAVLDEIGSTTPIEDLPKFRAVIIHGEMQMGAYCANLHRNLWPEILAADKNLKEFGEANGLLIGHWKDGTLNVLDMLSDHVRYTDLEKQTLYLKPFRFEYIFSQWLMLAIREMGYTGPRLIDSVKINVAGKNPGTFDIPRIESMMKYCVGAHYEGCVKFHRRVLDPASHFVQESDEHIPDLQTCLDRAGIKSTVSHTAVDDALDVVKLIRYASEHLKNGLA